MKKVLMPEKPGAAPGGVIWISLKSKEMEEMRRLRLQTKKAVRFSDCPHILAG